LMSQQHEKSTVTKAPSLIIWARAPGFQ
jgi:hypothetical protein